MISDRRSFLKSLAAAGLVVGAPAIGKAATHDDSVPAMDVADEGMDGPITPVVAGGLLDEAFLAGLRASAMRQGIGFHPAIRLRSLDASMYARLDAILHSGKPVRLAALMDDASAALAVDLVRSAGGRVLALQHHRAPANAAGAEWASALGASLASGARARLPDASAAGAHSPSYVSFCCLI